MLKILVVEDNPIHQEAAKKQLNNYDVTIMKSFTEFFNAVRQGVELSDYDVVLTDVKLPSPQDGGRGEVEAATGFVVALKALQEGVKMVGIITDVNHHEDVYGKAMDLWMGPATTPFVMAGGVTVYPECGSACTRDQSSDNRVKNWIGLLNGLLQKKHIRKL